MLHRPRFPHTILALALATLAAACGSDSATAPRSQPVSLDQVLSELALPASYAGAFSGGAPSLDGGPEAPSLASSSCAYAAASQSFVCAPVTLSGVTYTQSYTLLSASGAKQSAFDPKTTDAVRVNSSFAGSLVNDPPTLNIDVQSDFTLSGILSGVHTLNGTSTSHLGGGGDPSSVLTTTLTMTNLVLPRLDAGKQAWPVSGTIAVEATGPFDLPYKAVATFNGTSTVTVVFTSGGITSTCRLDLSSQAPSCA